MLKWAFCKQLFSLFGKKKRAFPYFIGFSCPAVEKADPVQFKSLKKGFQKGVHFEFRNGCFARSFSPLRHMILERNCLKNGQICLLKVPF